MKEGKAYVWFDVSVFSRWREKNGTRSLGYGLNRELVALFFPQVPDRADKHASADEKLLLSSFQPCAIPAKIGPIQSLPVPSHER